MSKQATNGVRYFAHHTNLPSQACPKSKPILLQQSEQLSTSNNRIGRRRRRRYSDSSEQDSDDSYEASSDDSDSPSSASALASASAETSSGGTHANNQQDSSASEQRGNQPVATTKSKRKNGSVVPSSPAASSESVSAAVLSAALMQNRKRINAMIVKCIGNPTFAPLIERALYSKHGGVNKSYNHHARELISSFKVLAKAAVAAASTAQPIPHQQSKERNHMHTSEELKSSSLFERICSGSLSAIELVNMSTSELAPESLQQARLQEAQVHMKQSLVKSTANSIPVASPAPPSSAASSSSSSLASSKKRKAVEDTVNATASASPFTHQLASSITISKRTKKPIEVCEIVDDDELVILPPLEKPFNLVASAALFEARSTAHLSAPTGSDHLPTFSVASDAVPVYDGRLSFSQPRRGELHVHFYTLPAPALFPHTTLDATLDYSQSGSFSSSSFSSRLNCWRELLPPGLDEPQRMNLLKIDTYIQFKSTSHKDSQSLSSSGTIRHENYHRFYPVTFVMRNMDVLLEGLREDLTKFHITHDLAIAINFEHSYIPVEQQCCIWLMPPDTVKHLSQDTMRRILHWSHVPSNGDWWGILWIKLDAYETMWQKFRTKQRKRESVMDVPSDDELDEQHLPSKPSDNDNSSLSSISPSPLPTRSTAQRMSGTTPSDAANDNSSNLLTLMHNPAVASSTAQYLSSLLQKVRSAPPAAAAAAAVPPIPNAATAPTPPPAPVTPPAMPPSAYVPMPPHAYHQLPPPPPPSSGVYPPAPPVFPPPPSVLPPHYTSLNPHAIYAAPPPPFVPLYPHVPPFPPLPIGLLRPPPPPSYGGLQPPYFPPLEPEDLEQSSWNSTSAKQMHPTRRHR